VRRPSPPPSPLAAYDNVDATTCSAVAAVSDAAALAAIARGVAVSEWGRMYQRSVWFRRALDRVDVRTILAPFILANTPLLLDTALEARAQRLCTYVRAIRAGDVVL
jgi:hypothetical protein